MRNIVKGEKHFTSSVWILTKTTPKKVVLIHHKKFEKWVQPGGHVEMFENPIETAIREVKEETGLDIEFFAKSIKRIDDIGVFLPIPEFFTQFLISERTGEPEHFHLDINYVLEVDEQELRNSSRESHDIGWFTKEEAFKLPIHENTKLILQKLL